MAHDPRVVANWLINRGIEEGNPLTHIEVQKLLYFAHGWTLAIFDQPLHEETWEAWQYGPVLRPVYFELNYNQGKPIRDLIETETTDDCLTEDETAILEAVYKYRELGTFRLVGISHSKGGPWDRVWHGKEPSDQITNDSIKSYFQSLQKKEEENDE